jgi:hypothetical protein
VSRDFTRVAFNSNWSSAGDDIDDYIVHIPASALPGGTTTTKPSHVTGGNSQPAQTPSSSNSAITQDSGVRVIGGSSSTSGNSTSTQDGSGNTTWVSPGERLLRRSAAAMRRASRSLVASRRLRAALFAVPSVAWWHSAFDEDDKR